MGAKKERQRFIRICLLNEEFKRKIKTGDHSTPLVFSCSEHKLAIVRHEISHESTITHEKVSQFTFQLLLSSSRSSSR